MAIWWGRCKLDLSCEHDFPFGYCRWTPYAKAGDASCEWETVARTMKIVKSNEDEEARIVTWVSYGRLEKLVGKSEAHEAALFVATTLEFTKHYITLTFLKQISGGTWAVVSFGLCLA